MSGTFTCQDYLQRVKKNSSQQKPLFKTMQNIPRYPFDMPIFTMEQFHFKENSPLLNYLIIGGGGGASKTGVKNKLVYFLYFL